MPDRYAVMGNPIEHSLSPVIHQLFAEQTGRALVYEKIKINVPLFERQVEDFFKCGGKGLNITLPCKQRAFAMSDKQSARCLQAGAANTLWHTAGHLYADNTDGIGLLRDLCRYIDLAGKKILLLGAGGAACGVLGLLLAAKPAILVIANRTLEHAHALQRAFPQVTRSCGLADLSGDYDLILNATSASLDGQSLILPPAILSSTTLCYDLAYNRQGLTPFVAAAQALGCIAVDGLGMLVEQAAEAFFIWHGVMPETIPVIDVIDRKRKDGCRND